MQAVRNGISWAGLAAGPGAWAISAQTGYSMAHWQCLAKSHPAPWVSLLGMLIAAAGAYLSWRALVARDHGVSPPMTARTRRFLAGASLGIGALFALAMLMQMTAGLVFGGCEL